MILTFIERYITCVYNPLFIKYNSFSSLPFIFIQMCGENKLVTVLIKSIWGLYLLYGPWLGWLLAIYIWKLIVHNLRRNYDLQELWT